MTRRSKTDALDAQVLAQFALERQPTIWTPPPQVYHELRQRLVARDGLLEMRQQARNQRHALLQWPVVIPSVRDHRMWEPPFSPDGYPRPPADTAKTYTELVAAGRRGDAPKRAACGGGCGSSGAPVIRRRPGGDDAMSNLHRGFQGADRAADAAPLVYWLELADAAPRAGAKAASAVTAAAFAPALIDDFTDDVG